jgi:hypothetical protein
MPTEPRAGNVVGVKAGPDGVVVLVVVVVDVVVVEVVVVEVVGLVFDSWVTGGAQAARTPSAPAPKPHCNTSRRETCLGVWS